MALRTHPGVVWLLLLALPFQGASAVYLQVRGPGHSHFDGDAVEHAARPVHPHRHDGVEHHHHPPGDRTVVEVEEDAVVESLAQEETTGQGGSGGVFPALVSAARSETLSQPSNGAITGQDPPFRTRFLGRLERPPRIAQA